MAANLEDVPSLDLMHELLRRMKCSSKPDKRLILIGTAWTDLSLSPITFLLAGAWSIRRSCGTGRERPPLVDVLIRDPREVFSFHEEPWFFFFFACVAKKHCFLLRWVDWFGISQQTEENSCADWLDLEIQVPEDGYVGSRACAVRYWWFCHRCRILRVNKNRKETWVCNFVKTS